MNDGNEVRLVYSDDPRMRGAGIIGTWLERTELREAQEQAKLKAAAESGNDVSTGGPTAAGDARKLRGIPAIGRGVGGAIANSDPLRELLRKERRHDDDLDL